MRSKKSAASFLSLMMLFILGNSVFAAPDEFELKFQQTYLITNNMSIATIPELDPFTYTLSDDVDISFTTLTGINQIYKGDLSKVEKIIIKTHQNKTMVHFFGDIKNIDNIICIN